MRDNTTDGIIPVGALISADEIRAYFSDIVKGEAARTSEMSGRSDRAWQDGWMMRAAEGQGRRKDALKVEATDFAGWIVKSRNRHFAASS